MPSRPIKKTPATRSADRFPEFPPRDDMQNSIYLDAPAHQAALFHHFGIPDTTIILSEVPLGRTVRQRQGLRVPDLLVAFGVDRAGVIDQHGYSIEEHGKPPDFVLELASSPPVGMTTRRSGRLLALRDSMRASARGATKSNEVGNSPP